MPEGVANVGAILAQLRLDASDWDREINEAMAKEDELKANSPEIKIKTDSAAALASLEKITRAQNALADAQRRVRLAENRVNTLADLGDAIDPAKLTRAQDSWAKATRDADLAQLHMARTVREVVDSLNAESKATADANKATVNMRGLFISTAIAAGTGLVPAAFGAAGALVGLAGEAAVAYLALKGVETEMAAQTPIGNSYGRMLGDLKLDLAELENTAAIGVFRGFTASVGDANLATGYFNQVVGVMSGQLGNIAEHTVPGLIDVFKTLSPLMIDVGTYAEAGAAKFEHWAATSQTFRQFVATMQADIPGAEQLLSNLTTDAGHLLMGLEPLGQVSLTAFNLLTKAIADVPVNDLQIMVSGVGGLVVGIKAMQAASQAQDSLAGLAAKMENTGGIASKASGFIGGLGKALGYLGPVGMAAGLALGGLSALMAHHRQASIADQEAVNQLTQAILEDNDALGTNTREQIVNQIQQKGLYDAALKLGIAQNTLTDAVMGNQTALNQVVDAVNKATSAYHDGKTEVRKFDSATQTWTVSTIKASAAQRDAYSAAQQLGGALPGLQDKLSQAKQAADNETIAMGKLTGQAQAVANAVKKIPALKNIKVTMSNYQAVQNELALIQDGVNNLHGTSIPVTVIANAVGPANRMLTAVPHATGGWVNGEGTGTSDSNIIRASRGEFVVNARASAKYGPLLEQINAGGKVGAFPTTTAPAAAVHHVHVHLPDTMTLQDQDGTLLGRMSLVARAEANNALGEQAREIYYLAGRAG